MTPSVGVLALQGAFEPHQRAFARLGIEAREVRSRAALEGLTHLVLPGGESTTLARLLHLFELWEPIVEHQARGELALFGTCAGAILLSRGCGGTPTTLGCLNVETERNAYGTQADSFIRPLAASEEVDGEKEPFCGVFIRAPRLKTLGAGVRALARAGSEVVAVTSGNILATTFHPELTEDARWHAWFLKRLA